MLATFGDGQVFWAFLVFFFWIIWIWLLIVVFSDLFRSDDLSECVYLLWLVPDLYRAGLGTVAMPGVWDRERGDPVGESLLISGGA